MRVRKYPLGAFIALTLAAAYLGLAPSTIPSYKQSDKVLHFITFLLLTTSFYWILETNRRKNLQLTVFVCTVCLGLGSEVVQGLLPNGRDFDLWDILANVLGSGTGVLISTWYHKRMLERKRAAKYTGVPGEDLELGESGIEEDGQETGVTSNRSLEAEVDNWDENAEDWDDDEPTAAEDEGPTLPSMEPSVDVPKAKRDD